MHFLPQVVESDMPSVYGILFYMKVTISGLLKKHYPAEYNTWQGMKARCNQKGHKDYHNYGGKGIKVCERWCHSFPNFLADMGPKPSPSHSIDRRNNAKRYDKSNCRWATLEMQAKNKRHNKWITYQGKTKIIADWARELGRRASEIQYHLDKGKKFPWIYKRLKSIYNRPPRRIWVTYKGKLLILSDLSKQFGIQPTNFYYWYKKGKSLRWIINYFNKKTLKQ